MPWKSSSKFWSLPLPLLFFFLAFPGTTLSAANANALHFSCFRSLPAGRRLYVSRRSDKSLLLKIATSKSGSSQEHECFNYVYVMYMLCICYVYVMYMLCICYVYVMYMLCICYVYVMYMYNTFCQCHALLWAF